jgi:pimeloyl-ACP methyl ester carboxylesterase
MSRADPISGIASASPVSAIPVIPSHTESTVPPRSRYPLLPGVRSRIVRTARLRQHIYESGPADANVVIALHGNLASGRFFEELMVALPEYRVIAPDMRGYGASEAAVVDATRGMRDFSDDLHALVDALQIPRFHVLGWSMGASVAMQYVIDHSPRVRSLALLAPGSPYGYGGTHGLDGQPNYPDFAGSGAGLVHPAVRAHFLAGDTSAASFFSARTFLRETFGRPMFRLERTRENILVEQMLMMAIGDQHYPGDSLRSPNWPYVGPGRFGPNNALSPKYLDQSDLALVPHAAPILWIRGSNDRVASDAALTDPAMLGKLRVIPRWPGAAIYPPQPMLSQLRALLRRYAAHGGLVFEEVLRGCGHSPHIEHLDAVLTLLRPFLYSASLATGSQSAALEIASSASGGEPDAPAGPDELQQPA